MPLLLLLAIVSIATPNASNMNEIKTTPNAAQSEELNRLNSERKDIVGSRQKLESGQDFWHTTYIWLGAVGVLLVAGSWISQKVESSRSYSQRPLDDRIAVIDARIAAINDEVSKAAIQDAKRDAEIADQKASEAGERAAKVEANNLVLKADLEREGVVARTAEKELAIEQRKTADAQKEAVDAQSRLTTFLINRGFPRQLKIDIGAELIKLPPAKAEVLYDDADPGSIIFAFSIHDALKKGGWDLPEPISVPAQRFNGKDLSFFGVEIRNKEASFLPTGSSSDLRAELLLANAVAKSEGVSEIDAQRLALLYVAVDAEAVSKDTALPPDFFRIIVAPRNPLK